jgi:hypothetical protein|tara:strand:+ start:1599 stop:1859 length:261 start_codon:yes stop_codon:yes gene_type:complete
MTEKMDTFYRELTDRTTEELSLTPASKTIILFRVAIEIGAEELGLPRVVYLLSRLMTATIGIMSGDEEVDYYSILEDWDINDKSQH